MEFKGGEDYGGQLVSNEIDTWIIDAAGQ